MGIQLKTSERTPFFLLAGSVFCMGFSMPAARVLLALSALWVLVDAIRFRRKPAFPPIIWLALAFILLAVVVTVRGVNPDLGVPKLRKFIWWIGIPVTAALITSGDDVRTLLKALAAGSAVLAVKICIMSPIAAVHAVRAGEAVDFMAGLIDAGSMTEAQRLMVGILISVGFLLFAKEAGSSARSANNSISFSNHGWARMGTDTIRVIRAHPWLNSTCVWWVLLAIQVVAMLLMFKRGSWICTSVLVLTVLVAKTNWKYGLLVVLCLVSTLALPVVRGRLGRLRDEFNVEGGGRLTMWVKITPALIKNHPWGVGYRSLTNKMMREISPKVEPHRDHLHSNLAQVLVATGWLGLAIYLVWMGRTLFEAIKNVIKATWIGGAEQRDNVILLMILLGLLLNGIVEYNFGDGEIVLIYAFVMGAVCAGSRILSFSE